jgi:hypothetical protein
MDLIRDGAALFFGRSLESCANPIESAPEQAELEALRCARGRPVVVAEGFNKLKGVPQHAAETFCIVPRFR